MFCMFCMYIWYLQDIMQLNIVTELRYINIMQVYLERRELRVHKASGVKTVPWGLKVNQAQLVHQAFQV